MSLLKNKKGVEGLPLKYIIIALVAALVVGIALQFTGTLRGGIQSTAETLNETLITKTTCELDEEKPKITFNTNVTECDLTNLTVQATITDACGINEDRVSFIDNKNNDWTEMELISGDDKNGVWMGSIDGTSCSGALITISAYDKATTTNQGTQSYTEGS